jgi:selenocysteine-specific elongation factor
VTVTRHADVQIELLATARQLKHGARVRFHQGTRELVGRIVLPHATHLEPGASACVRIYLDAPAALVRGDRFILRAYSPLATIAGGTILDPLPPRRGVRTVAGIARLERLLQSEQDGVMAAIDESGLCGLLLPQLSGRMGVAWDQRQALVGRLVHASLAFEIGGTLVAASRLLSVEEALVAAVTRHHASHPLEEGMPREEVRERLFAGAPPHVFDYVLRVLTEKKVIVARDRIALAGRNVALTDDEARARAAMIDLLRAAKLTPPDASTLATQIGAPLEVITRMATLLVRRGELVRAGDLLFHASALTQLKSEIQSLKQSGAADTIDVASFKDRYSVTRKYAIPLLEYLDRERITRRVGELRKIL